MKLLCTLLFSLVLLVAEGQPVIDFQKIPYSHRSFHENIDNSQRAILNLDGVQDSVFSGTHDENLNLQLTYAIRNRVDAIQYRIEYDSTLGNNDQLKYLRGLNDILVNFVYAFRMKAIKAGQIPELLSAYEKAMQFERSGQSIASVVGENDMAIGNVLIKSFAFSRNSGLAESKDILFLKWCQRRPKQIIQLLSTNPNVPFADSLITAVAYRNQEEIYNYAKTATPLAVKINNSKDPLVKSISQLAGINEGRQYFPFLDMLAKGQITRSDIAEAIKDDKKYYKLLVKTQVEYAGRLRRGDTPFVMQTLTNRLHLTGRDTYINVINALHEEPDNVRFKILNELSPEELYYLAVLNEDEMYTSSYVRGIYPKIFEKMAHPRGDTLLLLVNGDHFKKWIKIAANYNTLDDFLGRMDPENANTLMVAFVNNLDKTGNLEDAVDVANSYASVTNKKLQKLILEEVQRNWVKASAERNTEAGVIYSILQTLFMSIDSNSKIDVAAKLGIPSVYDMPVKQLKDSSGRVNILQFFYGDKDGENVYRAFLAHFSNGKWKITRSPQWTTVSSLKGTPVTFYVNLPLDEKQGLDEKSQAALTEYLESKNIAPTVVIHRGHSYYLSSTIKQLPESAKVMILGSCGAYQNLEQILEISPYAQIISSKQTGTGKINQTIIDDVAENLRLGKDLNWPLLWRSLAEKFKGNEEFPDYIPPHKNLGAVFIMAYKKARMKDAEE
jgi:hypothetical protein